MINLAEFAIQKRSVTYFVVLILVIAGVLCFSQLGRLEDPEFTVKTAVITTYYPGASSEQVELEVTDRIEKKIQEMSEVKDIASISRPGISIIKVNIKSQYWSDRLPQVWDILRKKVNDITPSLPPGASTPTVGDDFGYVFGFLLAVTSDGFSYSELEKYTKNLQKELSVVPGVARVDLWGAQQKRIFLDISNTQYSELGISPEDLAKTLRLQNQVVDAGHVDYQQNRFRIAPSGEFSSADAIANLAVTPSWSGDAHERSNEVIRIRDFANVSEGYIDPPQQLMRYNGMPAIALALAPLPGVNAIEVGQAVSKKMEQIHAEFPIGIDVHKISWQSDIVSTSIKDFMLNLLEAVIIVLIVLALTMGIRAGIIVGISGLILAILGTFIFMKLMAIDLQRVSLGALIISMGMMVDNAIVVVDGFMHRLSQGMPREKAAVESAQLSAWPLLAATIVASMAFFPIFASTFDTGEYAGSLFTVIAAALLLSWILSQTVTPLMCMAFIKTPALLKSPESAYQTPFYRIFKKLLEGMLRFRWIFVSVMFGLLALSIYGFRFVPVMYFPDSSRLQFMVDFWAPEGTRIQKVSNDITALEKKLQADPGVQSVSTFIGQGPPRFYLPVESEFPYSSYAQLIVNTKTLDDVNRLVGALPDWNRTAYPDSMVRVRKYAVGAFNNWKIMARFSGPANADPKILRSLSEQAISILRANPDAIDIRSDWREPVLEIAPQLNDERARWAGISRLDLAQAYRRSSDGVQVGLYRESDDLIPILMRQPEAERQSAAVDLPVIQVGSMQNKKTIPSMQLLNSIQLKWVNSIIWRWDRKRAITVECAPRAGITANALRDSVLPDFEKIVLPPGYTLTWDGEYKSSRDSQAALIPGIAPTVVIMLFLIVVLFNAYRPPLIIIAVIPFVMIGITFGLLITQVPFGFIALLGAMSLSGMMIKNSVVLLDQVNQNLSSGMAPYDAVVSAAVSRLAPVANAAATTILGVIPLLQDIFWVSLAVTIIFGLALGTILTMVLCPVLYCILYKIKSQAGS